MQLRCKADNQFLGKRNQAYGYVYLDCLNHVLSKHSHRSENSQSFAEIDIFWKFWPKCLCVLKSDFQGFACPKDTLEAASIISMV